ncbi:acetate--CoA ligase family protein [Halorussus halobius]|uniref:acetate--CoA ligase family protein n=1 Tax=Halorussus halobius TaxID=1710537 RepID=UPI001FCED413|nr:acetate--CoA ligase family protein [Halorussus halobius]
MLTWDEAESLLAEYGIDLHETRLATDADEAVAAAEAVGFPVVLKVDSPDVPHRTDAGAVRTDLSDPEAVREAYREIVANTEAFAPDARIEGVLVQPHAEEGVEALVGASRDPVFGPLVTVGSGGTAVESLDDAAVRVPPFSEGDARDAIAETRLAALLGDDRGGGDEQVSSDGDVAALAALLERVGDLCTEVETVAELDLNPVVVHDEGISVVDALVRTE